MGETLANLATVGRKEVGVNTEDWRGLYRIGKCNEVEKNGGRVDMRRQLNRRSERGMRRGLLTGGDV